MELSKKIPRLHPQCRMKTEEPSFCRLHIENGEERKTRLERWLTRKLSQPLLRPPPLPNNLHDLYFIGALATSELAKASCITPTNVLHIYVWRLPSSVDLLTPRFSVCARPSCAPEYAPGSVEHHQTAQLLHKPSTPYPPCTAAAFSKVATCIQSAGNNPQTMPKEQTSASPLKSLQFTHGTFPRGRACQERAHQGC